MKSALPIFLLLGAAVGCNDMNFTDANNLQGPGKGSNEEPADDEAIEPTSVAGAYLVCWSEDDRAGSSGGTRQGGENLGCRLNDAEGRKAMLLPSSDVAWTVASTDRSRMELFRDSPEVSRCAENEICHIRLNNLADRSSKTLTLETGSQRYTKNLEKLEKKPTKLMLLSPAIVNKQGPDVGGAAGHSIEGLKSVREGNILPGLGHALMAYMSAQDKSTRIDPLCRDAMASNPVAYASDAQSQANRRAFCFLADKFDQNKTGNCIVARVKFAKDAESTHAIFVTDELKPDSLKASLQELKAKNLCYAM